jgi:L-asparagine oxygenase
MTPLQPSPSSAEPDERLRQLGVMSGASAKGSAELPAELPAAVARTAQSLPAPGPVLELRDDEREQLQSLLDGMQLDPTAHFERFVQASKLIFQRLPERLRRSLLEFGIRGNLDGVLLLRGLAQDPVLPPTPSHPGAAVSKATFASELWLCVAAAALGEPVGYQQEKGGRILQDLFPTRANAERQSSESSSVLLAFHTELAFHPFAPDYVLLYGLRPDPYREARTMVASARRFLPSLDPADSNLLFTRAFRTGIDYSFGNTALQRGTGPLVPVLYGDRTDPFLRYDLDLMVGETPAARRALAAVRAAIDQVKQELTIEPGDLLVLDNRRSVHARSVFRALFDGRDRWLQRASVVRDLDASAADRAPGSRIIATDFSRYQGSGAHHQEAGC